MESIIINPESLATKLAKISLEDYIKSLLEESKPESNIIITDDLIKSSVYEDDGEVKSDFFDYYTKLYDFYFEIITNET